jgi:hypothetical protein
MSRCRFLVERISIETSKHKAVRYQGASGRWRKSWVTSKSALDSRSRLWLCTGLVSSLSHSVQLPLLSLLHLRWAIKLLINTKNSKLCFDFELYYNYSAASSVRVASGTFIDVSSHASLRPWRTSPGVNNTFDCSYRPCGGLSPLFCFEHLEERPVITQESRD